jgi:hypothetical protein
MDEESRFSFAATLGVLFIIVILLLGLSLFNDVNASEDIGYDIEMVYEREDYNNNTYDESYTIPEPEQEYTPLQLDQPSSLVNPYGEPWTPLQTY